MSLSNIVKQFRNTAQRTLHPASEKVLTQQVNVFYETLKSAVIINIVIVLVMSLFFGIVFNNPVYNYFAAALVLHSMATYAYILYDSRAIKQFRSSVFRGNMLCIFNLISGLLWGLFFSVGLDLSNEILVYLSVFIVISIIIASVTTLSYYLLGYLAFSISIAAPISIVLISSQSDSYLLLGCLLPTAVIAGFGHANTLNKTFAESFMLRFEKEDLVKELIVQKYEANSLRKVAENASIAKSKFLAAASHDLRQPLHASGLFIDALSSLKLGAEADEVIGKLSQSTGALNGLLHGLLDISRLDANVVEYLPDSRALNPLVHRICDEYQGLAEQDGLSLEVLLDERLYVYSDDVLLERIIRNLVDNAVKFTDTGAVRVSAKVLDDNSSGGAVALVIADTGRGIPVDQQENVFTEFTQLNNSQRDRQKGLGLGLAIVKKLCNLMEIELLMHSEPDSGTSFTLTLPIGEAVTETPLLDAEGLQFESRVILVIDDEVDILDGMRKMLETDCAKVVTATSVTDAINKFDKNGLQPDLIITDFRLSENHNGIDAIKQLRDEFNADIKAILVTGDTSPDRLLLAQSAKLPILYKPVTPAHLRETIQAVLR